MTATTQSVRDHRGIFAGQRQAITVQGPDAEKFLQGQLSQDIAALAPGDTAMSLLLQPQGKISAFVRVTRAGHDEYVLDLDSGFAETAVKRLERFKLRTDCTITTMPWESLTIVGPAGDDVVIDGAEFEVHGSWAGLATRDVFGPSLEVAAEELIDESVLAVIRIEAGIARMGSELDESTIPAAAGIVEASVSFTKGCFTGQELVARIDSRGNNVPRRLVGLVVDGDDIPAVGSPITVDGAEVGSVTTAGHSSALGRVVCLAYATRKVDIGDQVTLGSSQATVMDLPLVQA